MTNAEKINVGLNDRSYPILIGPNLLKAADTYLYDFVSNRHCIIISDTTIGPIYVGGLFAVCWLLTICQANQFTLALYRFGFSFLAGLLLKY